MSGPVQDDDTLPQAGEPFDEYLARTLPGVAAFLDDPRSVNGDVEVAFLFGAQWRLFRDVWEGKADERSKGIAARLISGACWNDAHREFEKDDHGPDNAA